MHCDKLTAMAVEEKLQKVVKDLLLCYGEADSLMLCSSAEPQALKPMSKGVMNSLSNWTYCCGSAGRDRRNL